MNGAHHESEKMKHHSPYSENHKNYFMNNLKIQNQKVISVQHISWSSPNVTKAHLRACCTQGRSRIFRIFLIWEPNCGTKVKQGKPSYTCVNTHTHTHTHTYIYLNILIL